MSMVPLASHCCRISSDISIIDIASLDLLPVWTLCKSEVLRKSTSRKLARALGATTRRNKLGARSCAMRFARSSPLAGNGQRAMSASEDPVMLELRASARRLGGVAIFSAAVNLLTLAGSLYMLQVYDRVLPGRSLATLVGLSLIVLLAYLLQGYFDALRARMLARIATIFDVNLQRRVHYALATL